MKRSPYISLVLLSTLTFTACDSDVPGTRSQYASVEDCIEDWGDPEECEQMSPSSGYYGPMVIFDDHDRKHYYLSKKHGGKLTPSQLNSAFTRALASNQSKAIAKTSSSVKIGGFGRSGGFFGASS